MRRAPACLHDLLEDVVLFCDVNSYLAGAGACVRTLARARMRALRWTLRPGTGTTRAAIPEGRATTSVRSTVRSRSSATVQRCRPRHAELYAFSAIFCCSSPYLMPFVRGILNMVALPADDICVGSLCATARRLPSDRALTRTPSGFFYLPV